VSRKLRKKIIIAGSAKATTVLAAGLFAAGILAVTPPASAEEAAPGLSVEERTKMARQAMMKLGKSLKGQLVKALEEGGPEKGLSICKDVAPQLAADVEKEVGFEVSRTGLKVRNPDNAPDDYEIAALKEFADKIGSGADPKTVEKAEIVETADGKVFRYMKAIPMSEKPCAACHGTSIKPEVKAKIDELYPEDEAVGFAPGELRGAFSITQKIGG